MHYHNFIFVDSIKNHREEQNTPIEHYTMEKLDKCHYYAFFYNKSVILMMLVPCYKPNISACVYVNYLK